MVAVSTRFVANLTILPVLIRLLPSCFGAVQSASNTADRCPRPRLLIGILLFAGAVALGAIPRDANAQDPMTAEQLVARVNAVEEGEFVTRKIDMLMTDRRGKERQRQTINYRKYFGEDKRTVLFYLEPANVRDTGFLIWDYVDPSKEDDQWLFVPALRKVRRISASDRGDYFLGTDFTYEDIKLDGKLAPLDYNYVLLGQESLDGALAYKLEGVPKTEDIARELGYSRTISWIDPETWMIIKVEYEDLKGQTFKTLLVEDIRQVDGFWTRHRMTMRNYQTEHESQFNFSGVDFITPIQDSIFSKQALARGH